MGMFLLLVVLIYEIGFAIYCLATKQQHAKVKNWIRIGLFIVFLILTFASVIEWSLRWGLIALLLFILAVKATVSLIRGRTHNRKYSASRIVWKSILVILVTIIAFSPAIVFPQHDPPKVTGEYKVDTATYTYIDESRIEEFSDKGDNRFVNVEFWYPKNAEGKFPLLVFSHGAYGVKASNTSTYNELASHGYIVASIDHPYHSFYTRSENGEMVMLNTAYNKEIDNMNKGVYSKEELYELIQKWMKLRRDDMNFVIDTIIAKAKSGENSLYQQIDFETIGVFGHSMGGAAGAWVGRERDDISAVVNIDAPFFSELIYDDNTKEYVASNEAYTTPIFNIYSDDVWGQLESNSLYAANKLDNEQFKQAYTVHFEGAKHLSLTDLPLVSPILANLLQGGKAEIDQTYCIETENELILEFFDEKLKGIGHFNPEETY
ncbi:alpha/beta hydrolase [Lysinibacillus yapensis]|uniref:Alpha/beta hydrolase n=1 Tax=Ureibacillus yapensis TaxID=2304605 RepID=A0A396S785_9BACL|nr:alpha/beta hydrolase [Lysinibacillus yapensis]RHW36161.1 alpha/beta hydrolase [Lysinibacillus yapensis]